MAIFDSIASCNKVADKYTWFWLLQVHFPTPRLITISGRRGMCLYMLWPTRFPFLERVPDCEFHWDIHWFIFRVEFPKKGNVLKRKLHNFRVNQLCSPGQWVSKCGCMTMFGADFIEISTDWFSGSNFLKKKWWHNFRVDQLCSLSQWLSKCGCVTMFGVDFIEIFANWFSGSNF
jgi:hypothetical protein